jgi:hypothetical protein
MKSIRRVGFECQGQKRRALRLDLPPERAVRDVVDALELDLGDGLELPEKLFLGTRRAGREDAARHEKN